MKIARTVVPEIGIRKIHLPVTVKGNLYMGLTICSLDKPSHCNSVTRQLDQQLTPAPLDSITCYNMLSSTPSTHYPNSVNCVLSTCRVYRVGFFIL